MCFRVARHLDFLTAIVMFRNFQRMKQPLTQNIARRARLSTGSIFVAVVLTIAAALAVAAAIGRHDLGGYEIQDPVSPLATNTHK